MEISKELIKDCIAGRQASVSMLYKLLFSKLMKICYRYASCKDDAVILLNNTFIRIIDKLPYYNFDYPFEGWAKKVAINNIINDIKKDKLWRQRVDCISENEERILDETMTYWNGEEEISAKELMDLIQKLPEPGRTILNLSVIEGYSHKEIAEMLNISQEASRWHLHKVKKILKIQLQSVNIKLEHHEIF